MKITLVMLVACTGTNGSLLETTPPWSSGTLSTDVIGIAAGYRHTCALNRDGSIACWGANDSHQADVPYGSFTALAAGEEHTCALRTDQTIVCWGDPYLTDAPVGKFTQISAGASAHTCAVRLDGTIACWGVNVNNIETVPSGWFADVATGNGACGIREGGTVTCWGGYARPKTPTTSRYVALDNAYDHTTCGIQPSGTVECWAMSGDPAVVTAQQFVAISNGVGILDDGQLAYLPWRSSHDWDWSLGQLPAGRFVAVSAGPMHACAVRDDGSVHCWGADYAGQSTPPPARATP